MIESIIGWAIFGLVIYFVLQLAKARLSRTTIHNHITHTHQEPAPAPAPMFYPVFMPPIQGGWNGQPMGYSDMPGNADDAGVDDSALHGMISDYYREHPHQ